MSILLEAEVCLPNEHDSTTDAKSMEGIWRFAKDSTSIFKFRYSSKSHAVPQSLLDYVTFSLSFELDKSKATRGKPRGRGRGRGRPLLSLSKTIDNNTDNVIHNETQIIRSNSTSAFMENSNDRGDVHETEEIENHSEDMETEIPKQVRMKEVRSDHPLFGLWEGYFETTHSTEVNGDVQETFFLHSFLGDETRNDFPPEPTISYAVLGVDEEVFRYFITSRQRTHTETCEEMPKYEYKLPLEELKDYDFIYGFGSNSIGRFSIVCAYRRSQNIMRCEKKYFLNKAIRRVRRYSWESPHPTLACQAETPKFEWTESRSSRLRHPPTSMGSYVDPLTAQVSGTRTFDFGISRKRDYAVFTDTDTCESDTEADDYKSAFMSEEGEIYEGGWYNGLRHGRGVCLYADGSMYEGQWLLNKEHGRGVLMTENREVIYIGDYLDGMLHGQGVYNFSNGDQYFGDWKEGNRHGKGEYVFQNGCRYVGDWKDNQRFGKGVFLWPDGSMYDGEWENDTRHGKGVLDISTGFKYEGSWINNYMEGRGNCIFSSGQEYHGGFRQGLREGRGSIKFSEGPEYEGRFKDDRFDGQGTLKITACVPGTSDEELYIPIQIQADMKRIHLKAGFGEDSH